MTPWRALRSAAAFAGALGLTATARAEDPAAAVAEGSYAPILGDELAYPRLEELRARVAFFLQDGQGYQSQAEPFTAGGHGARVGPIGRGSEKAWVLEPMAYVRVRQNDEVSHEIFAPLDIVSAASPDALDVVSTASRSNESVELSATTTYTPSPDWDVAFRYGLHIEEPLRSIHAGPAVTLRLFENNTVLRLAAFLVADGFDPITPTGFDLGFAARTTFSVNLSLTQVLSPTTLLDATIGTTEQWGTLETTWNSLATVRPGWPRPELVRTAELFPRSRNRDAVSARIAQHVPATHSTVKGSYRFYWDEDAQLAHTGELEVDQYLVPWLYLHGHVRLHVQSGISFFTPYLVEPVGPRAPRTSDSDLERLVAREGGLRLVFLRERAPASVRDTDSFDLGYLRYQRDNGLHVDYVSLGYGRSF
ncbi:MAG: DUF3570 domain-containing protein [Polyangiaceae bacterium]|nr:DUF3570 domain-containing protein [Polyangiaceae bacterium]